MVANRHLGVGRRQRKRSHPLDAASSPTGGKAMKDKILLLTALGMPRYEIAKTLDCSESYVRATVAKERKRLEMKAFQEAVAAMETQ
jgi:DNA-binding CsgD family transcriptional regulator